MGYRDTACPVVALVSPIAVGLLVSLSGDAFGSTLAFLIGLILLSCALVFSQAPQP